MTLILDQQSRLLRRYDTAAAQWQGQMGSLGYAAAYRQAVDALLPAGFTPARVLDAGCGVGDFAAAYGIGRAEIPFLTLVDPSRGMMATAQARLAAVTRQLQALRVTIEDLPPLPPQDLILCAHVLEHCREPVCALVRLGQLLTPGGVLLLIISKPHWCNWLIWTRWRHRRYAPAKVKTMLRDAQLHCAADMAFSNGPPARTSHAYRVTLPTGEPS